eukprot:6201186-Pleurochrysis_carterae.AAC.3
MEVRARCCALADCDKLTSLHRAAGLGNLAITKMLIDKKADVDCADRQVSRDLWPGCLGAPAARVRAAPAARVRSRRRASERADGPCVLAVRRWGNKPILLAVRASALEVRGHQSGCASALRLAQLRVHVCLGCFERLLLVPRGAVDALPHGCARARLCFRLRTSCCGTARRSRWRRRTRRESWRRSCATATSSTCACSSTPGAMRCPCGRLAAALNRCSHRLTARPVCCAMETLSLLRRPTPLPPFSTCPLIFAEPVLFVRCCTLLLCLLDRISLVLAPY